MSISRIKTVQLQGFFDAPGIPPEGREAALEGLLAQSGRQVVVSGACPPGTSPQGDWLYPVVCSHPVPEEAALNMYLHAQDLINLVEGQRGLRVNNVVVVSDKGASLVFDGLR